MTNEHEFWTEQRLKLSRESSLLTFKNWETVRNIPLYIEHDMTHTYAQEVLDYIKNSEHKDEWNKVLRMGEPAKGHSPISHESAQFRINYENGERISTTGFRLKSLHHLLSFEHLRQKSILDYDLIVEFGGGIGELAYTIFDRGYKGAYWMVDFPEVARIQRYYLEKYYSHISCLDHIPKLPPGYKILFIGTWSVSETPIEYRNKIASKIKWRDYLIVYQNKFKEIDNDKYFIDEWPFLTQSMFRVKSMPWHDRQGGNTYMVGTKLRK